MAEPQYKPGSKEDFHRLYQIAYQRVFRTLTAILADESAAEDCTQEAFLSAFKAWKSWKADAPAEAWIHRIAINTAISYRRKQRLREVGELVRRLGQPSVPDPTAHDLRTDLLGEMRRLPAKQAAALVLRHLHGYTNREIAAALGAPESTIASRLMEAKKTLRIRLDGRRQEIFDTSEGRRVPYSE
jgi:RNA polymerase sigma-70 factor (ECF subfamily)